MLKKWTAAVLTAALLLCCLAVGAAAKQVEADWSGLRFTMRDIPSGKTVSYSGDCGIPTILLFGGVGTCYNTNNFIQTMLDLSDEFHAGALQVFFVDLRGISDEQVAYAFSEVDIPQGFYIGVQETIEPASPLMDIVELATGARSYAFTMPAVAYLDASGTVKEAFTGENTKQGIRTALGRIGVTDTRKTTADVLVEGRFRQSEARKEFAMVNDLRANNAWYWNMDNQTKTERDDLTPLVYDYALEQIAMQRAVELAMSYSHTRPDGGAFYDAYTEQDYKVSAAGENIAYGFGSASAVQKAWEEETELYEGQGHRRNMLNNSFKAFGCACFEYDGTLFWAQEFSGAVVSANAVPAKDGDAVGTVAIPTGVVTGWWTEPGTLQMKVGETLSLRDGVTLFLSTKDNEEFKTAETAYWKSADDKTARVNANGTITALKEGSTAITAVLQSQNGDWTVSVNVNVGETVPFAAEKAAFESYKEQAARSADAAAAAGDGDACFALIGSAKAAIGALSYDEAKTPQANNAAVDAILDQLKKDLAVQRAADARLPGDVDGDGKIDAADARLALRIAVGLEPAMGKGTAAYAAANVAEVAKGEVTAADARLILRKAVNLIDEEYGK